MSWLAKLIHGDCLVENKQIKDGSVDLILTDLPYGVVKDAPKNWTILNNKSHNWDVVIDTDKIMQIAKRILRKNGKMVLFAQDPFSTELKNKAIPNVPYSYSMVWEKDNFANALLCNKAPVSYIEDILIFSKNNPVHDSEFTHPLRPYFKKVMDFIGLSLKQINKKLGHRRAEHTFYVTPKKAVIGEVGQRADHCTKYGSSQFSLCTEPTYNELIKAFDIDKMDGFKPYPELKEIDLPYKNSLNNSANAKYPSTFNLWQGKKYKSNILKYKKDYNGYHPTQKPILLLEDLIKTFSNENDLVVDLTMGSGSTGVACKNTGRDFIGIELDPDYFKIAKARINHKQPQLQIAV